MASTDTAHTSRDLPQMKLSQLTLILTRSGHRCADLVKVSVASEVRSVCFDCIVSGYVGSECRLRKGISSSVGVCVMLRTCPLHAPSQNTPNEHYYFTRQTRLQPTKQYSTGEAQSTLSELVFNRRIPKLQPTNTLHSVKPETTLYETIYTHRTSYYSQRRQPFG